MKGAKVSAGNPATKSDNRTGGARATLKQVNSLLSLLLIASVVGHAWSEYEHRKVTAELAKKQWLVFAEKCGEVTVHPAEEFQTGATDLWIRSKALQVVKLIALAGTKNVDESYAEARRWMTPEFREVFDNSLGNKREQIKQLNIFRLFSGGQVRVWQLKADDLPPGMRGKVTRYDVGVAGSLDTYRLNQQGQQGEKLLSTPFAYWVRLRQLEAPTEENPYGLIAESISELPAIPTPSATAPVPVPTSK